MEAQICIDSLKVIVSVKISGYIQLISDGMANVRPLEHG